MDADTDAITEFRGPYFFLSNFFQHDGRITAEHLFQAAKTADAIEQLWILAAPTAREAKQRGRAATLREDWDEIKIQVMECVLAIKFAKGTFMSHYLQNTGNADLVEGNWRDDDFWGVSLKTNEGHNWLGRLLMDRREKNRRLP
jgi:ribA/ribD-fused uncharacterized protein